MSNAGFATVAHEGIEITSNHASEATLREALGAPASEPPPAAEPEKKEPDQPAVEKPDAAAKADPPAVDEDLQPVAGEPDPASEAGKTLANRRRSLQSRIDQATAKQREAERKAADLERQLTEARRAPVPPKEPAREPAQTSARLAEDEIQYPAELANLPEPELKDFQDKDGIDDPYAAWIKAHGAWARQQGAIDVRREQFAERVRIERESATRAERERVAKYVERTDAVRTKHADFDAVVAAAADLPVSGPMREYFINDERGAEVQFYLCQHPEECTRIAGLTPALAFKELGKIEARIDQETQQAAAPSGPAPVVEEKTKAKPPIKPVVSSPVAVQDGPPPDDAPFEVHRAYWDKYDREHGRRV